MASDLKAKKVEMQIMAISKVVDQFMTSELSKEDCVDILKGILAKMGHEDKFH